MKTLPLQQIKLNIGYIYQNYARNFNKEYNLKVFNNAEINIQDIINNENDLLQ